MYNPRCFSPKKGFFLVCLFLSIGFCTQAQQAKSSTPPAHHEDITKKRPIVLDAPSTPVLKMNETHLTPDGQVVNGSAPKGVIITPLNTEKNVAVSAPQAPTKTLITNA